jgi:hypothetical protein
MRNNVHLDSHDRQILRAVLKGIACLLLLLGLDTVTTATPSVAPLRAGASAALAQQTPKVQRTSTPTLLRTQPPTRAADSDSPTRVPRFVSAPRLLPGQPNVDDHTVALYHFDSLNGNSALDATGHYTGTLNGNAWITSVGQYAGGLQLDGAGSYVRTGYVGDLREGTLEAFIDFSEVCTGPSGLFSIIFAGGEYGSSQFAARLRVDGYLNFEVLTTDGWQMATSAINPCRYLLGGYPPPATYWPYEAWRYHHVAGTWGPRGVEIWVDGILHGVGLSNITPPAYNLDYACNPQMQYASRYYPVCEKPTPGLSFPWSYAGGLPAYTTFLIGCDSARSCFKGRIDEVRISNVQRTFTYAVVPTSTPTPTQTPVPLTGEYAVDGNTAALYHLNSQNDIWVTDSVTQQTSRLWGKARIVPGGRYSSGLLLDQSEPQVLSYVDFKWGIPLNGTVETWANLSSAPSWFSVLSAGDGFGSNSDVFSLGIDPRNGYRTLSFFVFDGTNLYVADSGVNPAALVGSWHHLAGTWGSRGMQIWVDGMLCGTNGFQGSPPTGTTRTYIIGCGAWASQGDCMQGIADEVRISSVQRTFVPLGVSARLAQGTPTIFPVYLPLVARGPTPLITSTPVRCGAF